MSPGQPWAAQGGAWNDIDRIDAWSCRDTPLRRLDARAKIVVAMAYCATVVSFAPYSLSALTPLALFPLALAAIGQIPLRFLVRRLLAAAPFLVTIGIANPIFDRTPVLSLAGHAVSGGWLSLSSLLLRGTLTVSALIATVACTGMSAFCDGLRRLGLPAILCSQLDLLYRYGFVIGDETRRMQRAAQLRTPQGRMPPSLFVPLLGSLLLRSTARAERVHLAMLSRGGMPHDTLPQPRPWTGCDVAFVAGWLLFFAIARKVNLAVALGHLLTGGRP